MQLSSHGAEIYICIKSLEKNPHSYSNMIDAKGLALATFSILSFVMLIPPFIYHIKNKNIPACSLIFWLLFNNLTAFINALIWSGEDYYLGTTAEGYCDVTVRIFSGSAVGQLCATACLMFNLLMIVAAKSHKFLAAGSKRKFVVNVTMCWLTPCLVMGLSILGQVNRYNIVRYRGCTATYRYGLKTVMLVSVWNIIWGLVACGFAIATLFAFAMKRRDIKDILRCTNSGLNMRRFARLLAFSLLIILVLTPLVVTTFALDVRAAAYITEDDKLFYESIVWSEIYAISVGSTNIAFVVVEIVLSFFTFLIFGVGSEALDMYRAFLVFIGFTGLTKREDAFSSKEFNESRQASRETETSEVTAMSAQYYDDYKQLVLDEGQSSMHSSSTMNNSSPLYFDPSPDFKFEFTVNRNSGKSDSLE